MTKGCEICKKEFYVKPSHFKKRKCCSKKCGYELMRGKKHTKKHKRKIGLAMRRIGATPGAWWKGKKRPPITDIHRKKLSISHRGQISWNKGLKGYLPVKNHFWMPKKENHYNWKGGISKNSYPSEFNRKLKLKIRIRDNYTCCLCGKTEREELEELNRVLSINHIDFDKNNCKENNLNTLCTICNVKICREREYWTEYFNNLNYE